MKPLKLMIATSALALMLTAAPALALAQAAPTQTPPAQPPATTPPSTAQPPAATAPTPAPKPPAPFPQGAKMAFVNIQAIAANSAAGKDASARLKALNDKKVAEINEKNKQLQAAQTKLNTSAGVLSESARTQLEKDIDRMQRDIQFSQQNAQAEVTDLQNELQGDFQQRLIPMIKAIAEEKSLQAVFSIQDSGVAYWDPALDISDEVIKRLDAAAKTAAPKK
jgi:Skp family chaperone for outer membrane proteins